jgi:3-hydroxyisobutyrate dehydrogenase-like beta-hydroxyacid dehydrogenase
MTTKIAFIGMGEAGSAFVSGWAPWEGLAISAYDIKTDEPETAEPLWARYDKLGIRGCAEAAEALKDADLIFSTVTADQAVAAARQAAEHLKDGAFWCDCNSCAPSSKRQAAEVIEAAGGRYVDVAVMAPVHPKRNLTPLLISGDHAETVRPILESLPMAPRVVAGEVGASSSIKMIRSVMVKGLEALTAECVLAAVAAGVEDEVLGSLMRSHPGTDWRGRAVYNLERMMRHGARRAAEMEEVAKTLTDLGLPDDMAHATVGWQRRLSEADLDAPEDTDGLDVKTIAGALIPWLRQ